MPIVDMVFPSGSPATRGRSRRVTISVTEKAAIYMRSPQKVVIAYRLNSRSEVRFALIIHGKLKKTS